MCMVDDNGEDNSDNSLVGDRRRECSCRCCCCDAKDDNGIIDDSEGVILLDAVTGGESDDGAINEVGKMGILPAPGLPPSTSFVGFMRICLGVFLFDKILDELPLAKAPFLNFSI